MPKKSRINPFYVLLVPVGIAFVVTAFAYCVMLSQAVGQGGLSEAASGVDKSASYTAHSLIQWLRTHGDVTMLAELAVLSLLTFAAIATDQWRDRRPAAEAPSLDRDDNRDDSPEDALARFAKLDLDASYPVGSRESNHMHVKHAQDVPRNEVSMEGAVGCQVRWLVGSEDQAPNFAMRQFEVAPGGHTPRHHHPYEHEIFVLEGEGVVVDGDHERPLTAGDVVLVDPDDVHQFRNTGDATLKFLCLIPNSAADATITVAPECGLDRGES